MKQSTLFSVFTKNTALNVTSSHLDHLEYEKADRNADTLPKSTSKHVNKLPVQAESSPELDVGPVSECNGRHTKVDKISVLNVELDDNTKKSIQLDNEGENTKDENINCKRQGKLSLSFVKRLNAEVKGENKSEPKSETNHIVSTGKFVTLQTPMNLQSRIKESQQIDPVEHSDIQLPSGAAGKKGADSIGYADFLAQLSNKNAKTIQQNSEVSTSSTDTKLSTLCTDTKVSTLCTDTKVSTLCTDTKVSALCTDTKVSTLCIDSESNETKKTVSYSEFLGMFKSPPKVDKPAVIIDDDDDDEPEKHPLPLLNTTQQKEVKCKSIATFFTKVEAKSKKVNSSDSTTVTVTAEVHSLSGLVKHTNIVESSHTVKLPGKIDRLKEDKCEIEFLSSETMTDVEADGKKKVQGTKRNSEDASLLLQVAKKQKVEQESVSHKQRVEKSVKKLKKETTLDVPIKNILETQTSKEDNCLQKDKISTESAKIELVTPITIAVKSSQSTLQFGTRGLSLKKTEGLKIITSIEEDSGSADTILAKKPVEKHSSQSHKLDNEEDKKLIICKAKGGEDNERATKSEQKAANECKREKTSMDFDEPSFVERLSSPATTKGKTEIPEETSTPRRSARLAQSVHAIKDADVVEITSDDEDEPKRRGRKGVAKSSTMGGSPARNWPVKSSGKLAPIFTSVKSKDLTGKVLPAPVDPEQERLRREFMMSGIPDELKRQIATTAAITNVALDYPPLPSISHVQQIAVDDCLAVEIKLPKLRVMEDSFYSTDGMWESLGWKKTQNTTNLQTDLFKMFTANSSVEGPHIDLLLQELQSCDGRFPFRRTYEHLHGKVVSLETASGDVAENNLTAPSVIDIETLDSDDDDVIVCDASHISDPHLLKNTTESKASLWSDLHQPDSSEHIIGNTRAVKQLKEWLQEWKVVLEKQVRKASKISENTGKNKNKGGWSDDSDFTDSDEEEETLCNCVLITGAHGIGKTSSVYALAKELGYKVFEVNSSSLRSGKQLLAQLEEATQSHRVAQNKSRSAGISDTPPAGSSRRLDIDKSVSSISKPKQGTSAAFANLFRLTPQAGVTDIKNKASKLKLSNKESRSDCVKINGETTGLKTTEPIQARSQRKKKNEELAEIDATKLKKRKDQDKKGVAKFQTNEDIGLTSGSLNLTSASLILFDEVDVVFEEDKGFLATVQHFMMSTKIPIILTSTHAGFHFQLQARHDHIRLSQPPLVSAASFLSTLCLAHGIRISHQSVLNALRYTKGDIRRCLLNMQYWCQSGGGLVQIPKDLDPNSLKTTDDVSEKSVAGSLLAKTFRSRMVSTDDSNDSDFVSLRPARKKAKRLTSDDDSSMDTFTVAENPSSLSSQSKKVGTYPVKRKENKSKNIPSKNQLNVIKDSSSWKSSQLPLVHIGFEESLLGLHDCEISLASLMDLIQKSAVSCQALDHAVDTFSVISQALNTDVIYHVALYSLPLPKIDIQPAQLTITAPLEPVASEVTSSKKSRKRILQGDWMDSDGSDADSHLGENLPQNCPNANSSSQADSDLKDELSVNSIPEKGIPEINNITNAKNTTQTKSKDGSSSSLTKSVLAEFARYYDNLSYIDCLETKSSTATDFTQGAHLIPGLSDDETHSKLSHHILHGQLQCYTGSMNVLSARQFCSSIGEKLKNYEQYSGADRIGFKDSSSTASCTDRDGQAGIHVTDWPEELNLPLQNILPDFWDIADKPQSRNLSSGSAFKNVSKCLRPSVQSSDPALCLDYMPYLRDICRSEDGRRLAKTQRRFHHYLSSIGLGLKESTIASLASTYVIVPKDKLSS